MLFAAVVFIPAADSARLLFTSPASVRRLQSFSRHFGLRGLALSAPTCFRGRLRSFLRCPRTRRSACNVRWLPIRLGRSWLVGSSGCRSRCPFPRSFGASIVQQVDDGLVDLLRTQ